MKTYLLCAIASFALCFIFCKLLIPLLKKIKAGQNILSYVKEHKGKSGTPTMGGIAFVFAILAVCAFVIDFQDHTSVLTLIIGFAYFCVGILDDMLKQKHKENLGLRAWQKFLFQFLIAVFVGVFCIRNGITVLNVPFCNLSFDLGWFALPVTVFVFLATVNAVNLTDGLDGLAASVSIPFFATMALITLLQGSFIGKGGMSVICFSIVGALIAYLLFNTPPASVFMGDTGSLALGGFAAAVGVLSGNALYIAVIGLPFVLSVISVLIQVIYYKATGGKRVFLMAPLHHHFQQKGFSESKISFCYFTVTLLLGAVCVAFLC
jgi:phospho-N-acetylmuramoyl-pentapeptide-transferase